MHNIEITVTFLLWITTSWRATKDWKDRRNRALWWTFLGLSMMMTLRLAPGKYLDQITGITDLSYLLKHLFGGVLASAALLDFLQGVSGKTDRTTAMRKLRVALPLGTAVSMSALFFAKLQPYETVAIYQDVTAHLALLSYTVIFLGFLSVSLLSGVQVCWHWGRESGNGMLGWGLRIIGVGLAAGVLYSAVRIAALFSRFRGDGILPGDQDDLVATLLLLTALFLIVVGSTLPVLDRLRSWRKERQDLFRLRPLWKDLTQSVPSIRLDPPRSALAEHLDPRHVKNRLYRRTVEIRDAALALNDHAAPEVRTRAREHVATAGLIGTQAETAAEACRLASARRSRLRGESSSPQPHQPSGGGRDLHSEIRALTQLSEAFYSDLTRAFVDATEPSAPSPLLETQR
ncbi:MAB_1171c family putative transporter [Streptomyces sp. ST2-7A]|uniref:MAB_1171c family putative transporter n=1 Tax=Streptomyces sp. ST2-7A TaxID=2907214 RepID=UPI001F4439AE|nr:MAB_1171c family putative transporter [Streptomyces sp. ST2-7A]MCE7080141.1 hypothetical protein [Streptomyces sp. ST2-7A]